MPRGRDLDTLRLWQGCGQCLGWRFSRDTLSILSPLLFGAFWLLWQRPLPARTSPSPAAPRLPHRGQGDVTGIHFSSRPLLLSLPFTRQPRMLLPLSLRQHPGKGSTSPPHPAPGARGISKPIPPSAFPSSPCSPQAAPCLSPPALLFPLS